MKKKIFIDGHYGTTGLELALKLKKHPFIEIIKAKQKDQKNLKIKKNFYQHADAIILCLPDDASKQVINFLQKENIKTKILDTSTAYRTHKQWTYGFPELNNNIKKKIQTSTYITNPGCYAIAFIAAIAPLVKKNILLQNTVVSFTGISGYSGGGKKLISYFRQKKWLKKINHFSPLPYTLNFSHKHLAEMKLHTGLLQKPFFQPMVGNFYRGLLLSIPLNQKTMFKKNTSLNSLLKTYHAFYKQKPFIKINQINDLPLEKEIFLNPSINNKSNFINIALACDQKDYFMVYVFLDNLGKGAALSAIQNINLMLGFKETEGIL